MTETFTLTGRILDKSKRPVVNAPLVLLSTPEAVSDAAASETYTVTPKVTTNADGYLCVADADVTGVPLIVGVQYLLRGTVSGVVPTVRFTGTAGTVDISGLQSEPADLPPTYADYLAGLIDQIESLSARLAVLELGNPGAGFPSITTYPGTNIYPIGA